jgi:DNA segregation ATPase FtsK/SpoIIIE, S-DNA-T family
MIGKILKYQLLFLFIITAAALLAFYYKDSLPDNFLSISSHRSSTNFLTYYFFSAIAITGYYTGPWLFIPLVIFALAYTFQMTRRNSVWDVFNILTLLSSFLIFTYLLTPVFLGDGLSFLLKSVAPNLVLFLVGVVTFMAFIISAFRFNFWKTLREALQLSESFFAKHKIDTKKLIFERWIAILKNKKHALLTDTKQKVENYLKGEEKPATLVALPMPSNFTENTELKTEEHPPGAIPASTTQEELPLEYAEPPPPPAIVAKAELPTLPKRKIRRAEEDGTYFDLISGMKKNPAAHKVEGPDEKYFELIIARIEEKLAEFNIEGKIINILKGPVVDTFELELGAGVKVSKVTSTQEDLSLALYGAPIRMVYPMKDRHTVGIEVPRNPREIIYLNEIVSSPQFQESKHTLPIAMGKDAFGVPFFVDLAQMPHMLVAGSTGSGKSVFINTVLVSLLIKKPPRQMKLILIDPKQLELSLYAQLPHLFVPVVTDAKTASLSLQWAVNEMERRYSILREFGVRNIDGYNEKLKNAPTELIDNIEQYFEGADEDDGYELPYIVIIVDEFADLILTKMGKEIEYNVCRLAAKARAAGIHLIVATQRPSVDVITGLIKSNFPTRVSFRVTTSIDSRTILNAIGAEKLLGKGDMLYKNGVDTIRVHSAYVDEKEIESLNERLISIPPKFNKKVMDFVEKQGQENDGEDGPSSHDDMDSTESDDQLFQAAVDVVTEYRVASASMLQRRLKIGYNRAANLIEMMEAKGIVGPAQGSKPRAVLVNGSDDSRPPEENP